MPDWKSLESDFAGRPQREIAAVAARAARKLLPQLLEAMRVYSDEAGEWHDATDAVLRIVEAFARGEAVSRFSLDIAAEVARGAALSAAGTVRRIGPSQSAEAAELAFAAAAFAADSARAGNPARAATALIQTLRMVEASGRELETEVAIPSTFDSGKSWSWRADPD